MKTLLNTILDTKGHDVYAVHPDATVNEAVWQMNRNRVGAVLVMDGSRLMGIFSERDALTRVIEGGRDVTTTAVTSVMTSEIIAVSGSRTVEEAMAVMTQRRIRHLPVLDEQQQIVGIVSIGDLTRWMIRDREFLIDQLYNYVVDQYPA
jgi:CBS domain-containing protein